jgi:hypothetical protein
LGSFHCDSKSGHGAALFTITPSSRSMAKRASHSRLPSQLELAKPVTKLLVDGETEEIERSHLVGIGQRSARLAVHTHGRLPRRLQSSPARRPRK